MKTNEHIADIAQLIAESNSDLVSHDYAGQELADAITCNFNEFDAQEGFTQDDKKRIFAELYETELFTSSIDVDEQSAVSVLELRTMMVLCGIKSYTITV